MKIMVLWKTLTLTCTMPIKVTIFLKIWNDSTVITNILPQTVPLWNHHKSQVFDKSVGIHVPGKKVNLKNMKNGFGYEIWASGLRYHVRLVARVCLLPFSAHRTSKLHRNRWKEFERHRNFVKSVNYILRKYIWSSAAEAAAFKFNGACQQARQENCTEKKKHLRITTTKVLILFLGPTPDARCRWKTENFKGKPNMCLEKHKKHPSGTKALHRKTEHPWEEN
jgi:hypothetical protein